MRILKSPTVHFFLLDKAQDERPRLLRNTSFEGLVTKRGGYQLNPVLVASFNALPDAILVVAQDQLVLYQNQSANKLLGYGVGEPLLLSRVLPEIDGLRKGGMTKAVTANGFCLVDISFGEIPVKGTEETLLAVTMRRVNDKIVHQSRYESEFEELEMLGEGGFGQVWKAKNRLDGLEYAIKKVELMSGTDENDATIISKSAPNVSPVAPAMAREDYQIIQEVKTFARLSMSNHPNVIRYYNAWIESCSGQSILYIQMQLCPSSDLRQWLQSRQRIDPEKNMRLFKQIVKGLAHIHSKGFIHRDIKPENIFLECDQAFIGDFGLTRPDHDPLSPSISTSFYFEEDVGTCTYASPEQMGNIRSSIKSDIYALGLILYEMFHTFTTEMERIISIRELKEGKNDMVEIFPWEANLITSLLESDPMKRPNATEILEKVSSRMAAERKRCSTSIDITPRRDSQQPVEFAYGSPSNFERKRRWSFSEGSLKRTEPESPILSPIPRYSTPSDSEDDDGELLKQEIDSLAFQILELKARQMELQQKLSTKN